LSETVLPPVFGPVMIIVVKAPPSSTSTGTARSAGSSGWRALGSRMMPASFISGLVAFISAASAALANQKSSTPSVSVSADKPSAFSPTSPLSRRRMRSISRLSRRRSSFRRLLSTTIASGSMNKVAPLADWSCTMPPKRERYSCLTGRTNRSPRRVTMASCSIWRTDGERIISSSLSRIRFSPARISRRTAASSPLAASVTSPFSSMQRRISSPRSFASPRRAAISARCGSCPVSAAARAYRRIASAPSMSPATSSSSRADSTPPTRARRSAGRMSVTPPMGGAPFRATARTASSVCASHSRASPRSEEGASDSAASRPIGVAARPARRATILSKSSVSNAFSSTEESHPLCPYYSRNPVTLRNRRPARPAESARPAGAGSGRSAGMLAVPRPAA